MSSSFGYLCERIIHHSTEQRGARQALRYRSGVLPQNHPPDGFVRLCRTGKTGGAYRDRTDDPLLAKQVLSQLS